MIIGIAGGTGSGKTTVVEKIVDQLPEDCISIISQDSYYRDNSHLTMEERNAINYDHPDSIDFDLLVSHLKELKEGRNVQQPIYSYEQHNRLKESRFMSCTEVIIIEGILIFNSTDIRQLCDVKIYVDAPDDERLLRRIKRDINQRGRSLDEVIDRYENTLRPMHLQFIEPTKRYADIIIPEGGENEVAIGVIAKVIKEKLATES